jgi:hypothetical protein
VDWINILQSVLIFALSLGLYYSCKLTLKFSEQLKDLYNDVEYMDMWRTSDFSLTLQALESTNKRLQYMHELINHQRILNKIMKLLGAYEYNVEFIHGEVAFLTRNRQPLGKCKVEEISDYYGLLIEQRENEQY